MTNHILLLILVGLALAVLHIPSVIITLVIIGTLSFFTIKMFWHTMQLFSSSARENARENARDQAIS